MKKYKDNDEIKNYIINTNYENIEIKSGNGVISVPDDYNAVINDDSICINNNKKAKSSESLSSVLIDDDKKSKNGKIKVEIDANDEYTLVLRTKVGTIKIDNLNLEKLFAFSLAGDIKVKNTKSKEAIIKTGIGNILIEQYDSINDYQSIMLTNNTFNAVEANSSLKASSSAGKIKVLFKSNNN